MPRAIPALGRSLSAAVFAALDLAQKGELTRLAHAGNQGRFTTQDICLLYEISFLRIFVAWEDFLDNAFAYYLCGRTNRFGVEALVAGQAYAKKLSEARTRAYAGHPYALWHNPSKVIYRAQRHFDTGLIESVIASDLANLEYYAWVRHRIAHGHDDSKSKFDTATMALAAKRYPAARPGKFLRDIALLPAGPQRWIEKIGNDLVSLAQQIVP